jgi:hypothetical protein
VSRPIDELLVQARVLTRSSGSEIQGVRGGRLLIKTTSPQRMPACAAELLSQNEA